MINVLPEKLAAAEIAQNGLTELHTVKTIHERNAVMAELSDGFVALPGGLGTLEEIMEVFTPTHLKFHEKPCGRLSIEGYYDMLVNFIADMANTGFLSDYRLKI